MSHCSPSTNEQLQPTRQPSLSPTQDPTNAPTVTRAQPQDPTETPLSLSPSKAPSKSPSASPTREKVRRATFQPSSNTRAPTITPTLARSSDDIPPFSVPAISLKDANQKFQFTSDSTFRFVFSLDELIQVRNGLQTLLDLIKEDAYFRTKRVREVAVLQNAVSVSNATSIEGEEREKLVGLLYQEYCEKDTTLEFCTILDLPEESTREGLNRRHLASNDEFYPFSLVRITEGKFFTKFLLGEERPDLVELAGSARVLDTRIVHLAIEVFDDAMKKEDYTNAVLRFNDSFQNRTGSAIHFEQSVFQPNHCAGVSCGENGACEQTSQGNIYCQCESGWGGASCDSREGQQAWRTAAGFFALFAMVAAVAVYRRHRLEEEQSRPEPTEEPRRFVAWASNSSLDYTDESQEETASVQGTDLDLLEVSHKLKQLQHTANIQKDGASSVSMTPDQIERNAVRPSEISTCSLSGSARDGDDQSKSPQGLEDAKSPSTILSGDYYTPPTPLSENSPQITLKRISSPVVSPKIR